MDTENITSLFCLSWFGLLSKSLSSGYQDKMSFCSIQFKPSLNCYFQDSLLSAYSFWIKMLTLGKTAASPSLLLFLRWCLGGLISWKEKNGSPGHSPRWWPSLAAWLVGAALTWVSLAFPSDWSEPGTTLQPLRPPCPAEDEESRPWAHPPSSVSTLGEVCSPLPVLENNYGSVSACVIHGNGGHGRRGKSHGRLLPWPSVATSGSASRGRGRAGTAVRPALSRVLSREQRQAVLIYLTHLPFLKPSSERGWASRSMNSAPLSPSSFS